MKQMQTRREFIGAGCAALAGAAATKSLAAVRPEPAFMWGVLLHFGVNIQCDLPVTKWGKYQGEDLKLMTAADHVRFDEGVFDRITDRMAAKGLNTIVMDLEEAPHFLSQWLIIPLSVAQKSPHCGSKVPLAWFKNPLVVAQKSPCPIGNWQHWYWQYFHIGNILLPSNSELWYTVRDRGSGIL